ncbi:MAG: LCP family protein [Actinomycetota bacterium]|nr:LCP family protein [Actinomycetota bacterium]
MAARTLRPRVAAAGAVAAVVVTVAVLAVLLRGPSDPSVIVGYTGTTLSSPPTEPATVLAPEPPPTLPPPDLGRPPLREPGPAVGLKVANGQPFAPAIDFRSDIPVPDSLVFILVLGSDARPNEDLLSTRADSIHLLAMNPTTMQGTIVGFPRDSYVQYPRGGRGKINDALARGGPAYAAETVRLLTGLPIDYYVLTGFVGFQRLVDEVGGVDLLVDRRMNDRFSGARFEKGWHHFVGGEALAFSRNRNDVANGDFSRSEHQGQLLLAGLGKLRSSVADDVGLFDYLRVLRSTTRLDVPVDHLPKLAALARRLEPERITNVVLPGRVGYAGSASVVYLTQDAPRLFADLRDDAVIGSSSPLPSSPTSTSPPAPTTTSTAAIPTTTAPTTTAPTETTTTTALGGGLLSGD